MGKDDAADTEYPMPMDGLDTLRYERVSDQAATVVYIAYVMKAFVFITRQLVYVACLMKVCVFGHIPGGFLKIVIGGLHRGSHWYGKGRCG